MRGRGSKRLPTWAVGLILIVVIAVGSLLAYTKSLPWTHHYTVKAVFSTSQNIAPNSPVRIAGVNVGKVTGVSHLVANSGSGGQGSNGPPGRQAAVVTMQISDNGLPIHSDATMRLRPRLFLEGNLFVDLNPGTPEAPDVPDGGVIPMSQTSVSVQLDQIFSTLQGDVRTNLQVFLHSLGDAFIKYGGAQGFNTLYRTSGGAFKYTSQVNEALLGTEPHDLSGFVRNLDSTVHALDANRSDLANLITNFRIVTGSLAAHDRDLARAVSLIPGTLDAARPAFAALNGAFPAVRAFAREALPGVRSTPAALTASMPLLRQLNGLLSKPELRGLTHDLRPAIPDLTRLTQRTVPFLQQARPLSSCFNQVVIPWGNSDIYDPDQNAAQANYTHGTVSQETGYSLEGVTGESRTGDANGEFVRVLGGGGLNTVAYNPTSGLGQTLYGLTPFPVLGARPSIGSSLKTPFRPGVPCETQQPPNLLSGGAGAPPTQTTLSAKLSPQAQALLNASKAYLAKLGVAGKLLGTSSASNVQTPTASQASQAQSLINSAERAWQTTRRSFLAGKPGKPQSSSGGGG